MDAVTAEEFRGLRLTVFVAAAAMAVLAVCGVLSASLFAQPNTIKYAVTVIGAVLLALVATVRQPLKLLVGLAILVAPFDFVTRFAGMLLTPLIAVDVLALFVWLGRPPSRARSALRGMAPAFVLALIPALVAAGQVGPWTVWLAGTVITGCLAFEIAREGGGARFVASMVGLSGLIQAAIAVWESRTGHRLNLYQASGSTPFGAEYFFTYGRQPRPVGALPDPIGLGQVLALCLPLTIALAARARRWLIAVAWLAGAGVLAVALLLSLSRMSMVGAAFGLAITVVLLPRRALVRMGGGVAVMLVLVAVIGLAAGGSALKRRIDSIFHPTAAHVYTAPGDLTREHIWAAALKTAEANPLTGVGLGNVTRDLPKYGAPVTSSSHAHDTYLQFFAEGGVLGLLAIAGVILAALVDLWRAFRRHRIWVAGASGALVATLLTWITDVEVRYLQVSAMVAILLGLIAALSARAADVGSNAQPAPQDRSPTPRLTPEPTPANPAAGWAEPVDEAAASSRALALLAPSREDAGAERYLRQVAAGARGRGWTVHVGVPPGVAMAGLRADLAGLGVVCHPLDAGLRSPRGTADALMLTAREAWAATRLLRRLRPAATIVVLPHPDQAPGLVLAAAARSQTTLVVTQLVPHPVFVTRARRLLYGTTRSLGARWIAVSGDNQRRLAGALSWPGTAIGVIRNGVPPAPTPGQDERASVHAELGVAPEVRLILTVGRLHEQKGQDVIARSIGSVLARHPGTCWVWAGDGPARAWLERELEQAGVSQHVRLLGPRHDVARLLVAADLFLFPSRYEGSPFALLEAMASGLPVISSDAAALVEIVRDGIEGLVVPVGDAAALAHATSWALEHPAEMEAMAQAGRRRVAETFGEQMMVAQTLAALTPSSTRAVGAVGALTRLARRPRGSVRPRGAR